MKSLSIMVFSSTICGVIPHVLLKWLLRKEVGRDLKCFRLYFSAPFTILGVCLSEPMIPPVSFSRDLPAHRAALQGRCCLAQSDYRACRESLRMSGAWTAVTEIHDVTQALRAVSGGILVLCSQSTCADSNKQMEVCIGKIRGRK